MLFYAAYGMVAASLLADARGVVIQCWCPEPGNWPDACPRGIEVTTAIQQVKRATMFGTDRKQGLTPVSPIGRPEPAYHEYVDCTRGFTRTPLRHKAQLHAAYGVVGASLLANGHGEVRQPET